MVTIGVVVLLVAGVFTADLVLENSGHTDVMIMGQTLSFDIWGLFVLGLATGMLMIAGVQLLLHGVARDRNRRRIQRQRERDLAALTRAVPPPVATAPSRPATTAPTRPVPATTAAVSRPAPAVMAASRPEPVVASARPSASAAAPAMGTAVAAGRRRTDNGVDGPPIAATTAADAPAQPAASRAEQVRSRTEKPEPAISRAAERVPTPSRAVADDVRPEAAATRPRPTTHPRRGDRIVARVADLARGNRAPAAESTESTGRDAATRADIRS
ncbi:hypothetical protein [Frankia sp. R82]|uniref:hypothetical protein n=1 Tax=Frankia sp. R82 TaxID=2950553 RepID=UPI0020446C28|nr:hypothetical protein [Frankia sp. R82]MCM3882452.1 hypothetical protein [Frankia sp. R82]